MWISNSISPANPSSEKKEEVRKSVAGLVNTVVGKLVKMRDDYLKPRLLSLEDFVKNDIGGNGGTIHLSFFDFWIFGLFYSIF